MFINFCIEFFKIITSLSIQICYLILSWSLIILQNSFMYHPLLIVTFYLLLHLDLWVIYPALRQSLKMITFLIFCSFSRSFFCLRLVFVFLYQLLIFQDQKLSTCLNLNPTTHIVLKPLIQTSVYFDFSLIRTFHRAISFFCAFFHPFSFLVVNQEFIMVFMFS